MAIENYATAGAKARTWNRPATLLAKFFASKKYTLRVSSARRMSW